MNGLGIKLDVSCIFHKTYFIFYNRGWTLNSNNLATAKICSILAVHTLSDLVVQQPSFSYH